MRDSAWRESRPSDELVQSVVTGDAHAWQQLATALTPHIESIARSHQSMRKRGLAQLPDDLADIATATLERLSRDGFRNLARYLSQRERDDGSRAQSFDSWVYGATDFAIREHLRMRFGRGPKCAVPAEAGPSKRDLATNAGRFDEEGCPPANLPSLGITARMSIAEVVAYITAHFDASEAHALRLYYQEDLSFSELASALSLGGERDAEKLIRRLNARLRHHFSDRNKVTRLRPG